jgi:hypothetical protein
MKHYVSPRVISIALALVLLSACAHGKSSLQIGLQHVDVDLAFKGDPNGDKVIRQLPPLPLPIQPADLYFEPPEFVPVKPKDPCPKGPVGKAPNPTATQLVLAPPKAGTYTYSNKGNVVLTIGTVPTKLVYPKKTESVISNVTDVTAEPNDFQKLQNQPGDRTITFDLKESIGYGFTLTSYQVTTGSIQMVKRVTKVGDTESTFTPTPALTIMNLGGGVGDSWNSAGVDLTTGETGVIQGKNVARQTLDLCGTLVDSYKIVSTERFASLNGTDAYSSMTKDAADPTGASPQLTNIYNVATQFGGLFVRVETHTKTHSGVVTIDTDHVGLMSSTTPTP